MGNRDFNVQFTSINQFESYYDRVVNDDINAMQVALELANHAATEGEVPVGAIVVYQDRIIGLGYNCPITTLDPSAHAEVRAIRDAAKRFGNYRLNDCQLYVTIEPCSMCTGLMLHARIKRLVYGAVEPKAGAIESASQMPVQPWVNHYMQVQGGILANDCSQLISSFFSQRRAAKKRLKQQIEDGRT